MSVEYRHGNKNNVLIQKDSYEINAKRLLLSSTVFFKVVNSFLNIFFDSSTPLYSPSLEHSFRVFAPRFFIIVVFKLPKVLCDSFD